MKALAFLVGGLLPYLAVVLFVIGMIWRFRIWRRLPAGKMTLFPAPKSTAGGVLAEVFFFPSLFRGDRLLWSLAWVFHVTLALVFLGHLRVFTGLIDRTLLQLGMTQEGIQAMSDGAGGAAGMILLATGFLLLLRRLLLGRAREVSNGADFLILLLVLAIVATGDIMRFSGHFDLGQTRAWAWSLLVFSPQVPENGFFLVHILLALTLVIILPFSKLLHFGGIFFTQALIKRR